jgi:pimeloyl-ACP methyl ester carboxylesterase
VGAVAIYVVLVGLIAANETTLVYPGVHESDVEEFFPAPVSGVRWDSLRVRSSDGTPVLLVASRIADSLAPWMIFIHGNGSLVGSRWCVERYRLLNDAGFNVLAMEFRGMGLSKEFGPPHSTELHLDALATWNYLTKDLGVPEHRIAIYGWSLGGGVASELAVAVSPAALITEGAFTSLLGMGRDRYPWFPARWLAKNTFDNVGNAAKLAAPWIVFHGRTDRIVGFAHGEALAAAARAGKLVPLDAGHMNGVLAEREVVLRELRVIAAGISREAQTR